MRPEGTKKMAAAPPPSRKYPVRRATCVMSFAKRPAMVRVLAARMGPRAVARMAAKQRMKVMRSRFQSGQLSGSLGSSDGWGI
jgi:hypothetical protein